MTGPGKQTKPAESQLTITASSPRMDTACLVLLVVVVGEWLGLFEQLTDRVPFWIGLVLVLAGGFPIFRNVAQATLRRRVTSHTLMTVGVIAALVVGEWPVAAVVVMFMHVANYAERFTTNRARKAVHELTALAPTTARVERGGAEVEIGVDQVRPGDIVIVRPGEQIPVDGTVLTGHATIDQAAITGESMPIEAGPGARVFAASTRPWAICVSRSPAPARTPRSGG
jgi:Cu+-exporting ATPase